MPFDTTGLHRGDDGRLHYEGLQPSVVAMLRATVDQHPAKEALVEVGGPRVTYRALWDRASRVAGGLRAAGVQPGDRVAIRLPNGVPWCLAFFGTLLSGAIAVPVNTRLVESEVDYLLEDSKASFVFAPGGELPDGPPLCVEDAQPDDVAAIFYTSGTTGRPKGSMTTHENFLANIETVVRCSLENSGSDMRMLVSVPLFHVTGCNSQLLVTCALGGTTVIMPSFDVDQMLETVVAERTDALVGTPAVYWLLLNRRKLSSREVGHVRWATFGGAPMPPEHVARMREAFPSARLGNGYGMTETASVSTFLPHEYCSTRPESVGFAAPNAELMLDTKGFDDGSGELLIRSSQVTPGYWGKPEETRRALVDGWLRSGDVARIDHEGLVQIVDRVKDLINRGGENVYSIEVENALALHPDVAEVSVVGVPDDMMGEKVGAVLVAREGRSLDREQIFSFAAEHLADFKVPQYLVVRTEPLPRNPNGKILKSLVRSSTEWGSERKRSRRP